MLQHIAHLLLKQKEIAPCNVSYSFSNLCFVVSCIAVFICVEIVNARVGRGVCPGAQASPPAVIEVRCHTIAHSGAPGQKQAGTPTHPDIIYPL